MEGTSPARYTRVLPGIAIIVAVSALLPVLVHARSLAEIERTEVIRYCVAPAHPAIASVTPNECDEDCKFAGSAPQLAQAFTDSLGARIVPVFKRVAWQAQFENDRGEVVHAEAYTPRLLASGECDLYLGGLTKNAWRSSKLDFVTLHPSRMMVVVHKTRQQEFADPSSLGGATAAILANTSYHRWLQQRNKQEYASDPVRIELVDAGERIRAVNEGSIDFTMLDANLALWTTRHQAKNTVAVFTVGPVDEIGWAFRKQDKHLQAAVHSFFDEQRSNPASQLNVIWKQTFGMSLSQFVSLIASIK